MNPLKLPKKVIDRIRHRRVTARIPRHDDVYIVEFPKSGVTWLSTILANMALTASGRKETASFSSSSFYVPDVHVTRDIGDVAYDVPPSRLIKSHSEFNPNYAFVIYLARHPLDVMRSYFRFNAATGGLSFSSFDDFCRSADMGVPAWKKHVKSWLKGGVVAQRLHLCRYEDLLQDAVSEIELISNNFGWNIGSSVIESAVSGSSVEIMKASEELYRLKNPRYNMTFIRGKNEFEISDEIHSYINEECKDELRLLGYE